MRHRWERRAQTADGRRVSFRPYFPRWIAV